jgi:hypothetical protein
MEPPSNAAPIDKIDVAQAMILRGGSFVQCLGQALLRADEINAAKIKLAWPVEWERYEGFVRMDRSPTPFLNRKRHE